MINEREFLMIFLVCTYILWYVKNNAILRAIVTHVEWLNTVEYGRKGQNISWHFSLITESIQ